MRQSLRSTLRWLLLAGALCLALLPVMRSCAGYIDVRTRIAADRWQEAKAGWRAGWQEAGAWSLRTLVLLAVADVLVRLTPLAGYIWHLWRQRPRWQRATLRLKRRKSPESRSSALEL